MLAVAFIVAAIVGTLSHEAGHYVAAKILGYKKAEIHYGYTSLGDGRTYDSITSLNIKYQRELEENVSFPEQDRYEHFVRRYSTEQIWITAGGPLQTLLTGTTGLFLLFAWRRSFQGKEKLSVGQWVLILITLFWLRQTANMIVWMVGYFFSGRFSHRGDEIKLALQFGMPFWVLATITGVMGIIIQAIVVFKFIPAMQRFTFVIAGLVGGVAGYFIWLYLAGPVIFP